MKRTRQNEVTVRVGIDTGGTFTDFVYEAKGELIVFKVASTPDDPSRAINEGLQRIIEQIGSPTSIEVIHGTTVGTNALLQHRGARTALVTTAGFEDVIEIGRQARPELYNLNAIKPPALVPSELRFGVAERVVASGEVLTPLSEKDIARLLRTVRAAKCEAVAISLLFSFAHPEHEQRLAESLKQIGVPVSTSHEILPEYREYERTSTVVVNAYLQPVMTNYLHNLERRAKETGVGKSASVKAPRIFVMQKTLANG